MSNQRFQEVPCDCLERAWEEIYGANPIMKAGPGRGSNRDLRKCLYIQRDAECQMEHGIFRKKKIYEPA